MIPGMHPQEPPMRHTGISAGPSLAISRIWTTATGTHDGDGVTIREQVAVISKALRGAESAVVSEAGALPVTVIGRSLHRGFGMGGPRGFRETEHVLESVDVSLVVFSRSRDRVYVILSVEDHHEVNGFFFSVRRFGANGLRSALEGAAHGRLVDGEGLAVDCG